MPLKPAQTARTRLLSWGMCGSHGAGLRTAPRAEQSFSQWVEFRFFVQGARGGRPEAGMGANGSETTSRFLSCLLNSLFLYWDSG